MRKVRTGSDGTVIFYCPGCKSRHAIRVTGIKPWQWNGNIESPTFYPSVKVEGTVPISDEEHARIMAGEKFNPKPLVCHSYVRNGKIEYLSDCTHELAGRTVEIPEIKVD